LQAIVLVLTNSFFLKTTMHTEPYQQAQPDAQEILPVSDGAVKAFENSFPKILDLVNEKFSLETKFMEGDVAHLQTGMLRDMLKRFGDLLRAVYEFHLYQNLPDEFSWYLATFSKRGFSEEFFTTMLKTWQIGIHSVIRPPHSHELSGPLQWLQQHFPSLYAQSGEKEVELPEEMRLFVDLLLSKKRKEAANHMLLLLNQGVAIEKLYTDLLTTALREIGSRWQKNEISVVDVHVATDICRYIIMRLVDSIPIKTSLSHRALVTCVPGEEHEMGAEIVENFLEMNGWAIESMGHIAPETDIMKAIVDNNPDVVFLSVTLVANLPAAKALALRIREHNSTVKIIIGGYAAVLARNALNTFCDFVASSIDEGHKQALELVGYHA
jgi:methanogenic corrinoid protein MtbC1